MNKETIFEYNPTPFDPFKCPACGAVLEEEYNGTTNDPETYLVCTVCPWTDKEFYDPTDTRELLVSLGIGDPEFVQDVNSLITVGFRIVNCYWREIDGKKVKPENIIPLLTRWKHDAEKVKKGLDLQSEEQREEL